MCADLPLKWCKEKQLRWKNVVGLGSQAETMISVWWNCSVAFCQWLKSPYNWQTLGANCHFLFGKLADQTNVQLFILCVDIGCDRLFFRIATLMHISHTVDPVALQCLGRSSHSSFLSHVVSRWCCWWWWSSRRPRCACPSSSSRRFGCPESAAQRVEEAAAASQSRSEGAGGSIFPGRQQRSCLKCEPCKTFYISSIRSHRRRSAAESCSKLESWPLKTSLGSWPWKLPNQMAVPKTSRLPPRGSWPWKLPNQMTVPKAPAACPCLTVCSAYSPAGQEKLYMRQSFKKLKACFDVAAAVSPCADVRWLASEVVQGKAASMEECCWTRDL